ncbi:MAG: hypothetical protein M1839_007012 [Geoglossum umbratile]|nr:MAG: hypothetical protein M1839_007012 [Geoglossum umbratile]
MPTPAAARFGPRGTLHNPPGPSPWRISARLATYKAFESIFEGADERNIRDDVKKTLKEQSDWFTEGRKWENWEKGVIELSDKLAANLYYVLEQYIVLIRVHANKYHTQKIVSPRSANASSHDGSAHGDSAHDDSAHDDSAHGDSTHDGSAHDDSSLMQIDSDQDTSDVMDSTITTGSAAAADGPGVDVDDIVERVVTQMEQGFIGRLSAIVQSEAGKFEDVIELMKDDIKALRGEVCKLKGQAGKGE